MFKNFREEEDRKNSRRLLEAKINDKYRFAITKNKIMNTDFLNMTELVQAKKYLHESYIKNYMIFGGNGDESDRNILIFYPEKFSKEIVEKNYSKIVSVIRIKNAENESYEHRMYLSGIMKLGIKREKIGDILVKENSADIIVLKEIAEILKNDLQTLTRFRKSTFDILDINEIEIQKKQFEEMKIIVNSLRLDNFVSELARCSRGKAIEILNEQRVLVNYELELKSSKKINLGDVITIRGKGKFIVGEINSKTKSDKYCMNIKKYI